MPNLSPDALLHSGHCMNPGDILDGRYRITGLIGEGTFAYVYRARHIVIDTLEVAIKVLKPAFVADEELRQRFVTEAETVALLRNKHTVRIGDMGRLADGRPYIGMEYCAGLTLNQYLRLYGPASTPMVAHIADGVLQSLREAHDLDIIHRDIKPSNIILTHEVAASPPLVRVLDFGIAHTIQSHNVETDEASSNFVFCTPSYAAPEVLHGKPSKSADLYALGLTLAEMIEGEPVYPNEGFYKVAARQTSELPVPLGPVTRAHPLFPVLERACHKDQRHRYTRAQDMLRDVRAISRSLDAQTLRADGFPPPIGCSSVDRCAVHRDIELLARAQTCPNPACNLRLNPLPARPGTARAVLDAAPESNTLRAALAMEIDDLAFDLDAFTDTEANPRVSAQEQDFFAQTTGRFIARPSKTNDAAPPLHDHALDDATSFEDSAPGTVRTRATPLETTPSSDAPPHGQTGMHTARLSMAQMHAQREAASSDALLSHEGPPASPVDAPASRADAIFAAQRMLFPTTRDAASGRRKLVAILVGALVLSALIYVLFAGLPRAS